MVRVMRHALVLAVMGLLAVARPSRACLTVVDRTELHTTPGQGEEGVPTDVAVLVDLGLMYIDSFAELPAGLCTLRAEDGSVVPSTTERVAAWHAEVRPVAPLAANTRYELEVQIPIDENGTVVPRTVEFTTGAGPLVVELSPPVAGMQHWQFTPEVPLTSCDYARAGTCIALPAGELVEALPLLADGTLTGSSAYLYDGPFTFNLTPDEPGHPYRCMRLRRRAANGTYSEPTVLCSADAPTIELSGNSSLACTPEGIRHEDTLGADPIDSSEVASAHADIDADRASESNAGCALRPGSLRPGSPLHGSTVRTPSAVLVALSLLAAARRRKHRSP